MKILDKLKVLILFISIMPISGFTWEIPMNKTMNIVTMNIHCFEDNWKFRLTKILEELVVISPDVVSFQEVCAQKNESQIEFIKSFMEREGYPLDTIRNQFTHEAWDKYDEYLVMFTKHPVEKIRRGLLPDSPLARGYLALKINNVWYVNTHLEHRADYAEYRKMQVNFLIQKFGDTSHLIMGDFNSSPDTEEQRGLNDHHYWSFFPGPTHIGNDGNSMRDIDGFWMSPVLQQYTQAISAEILFDTQVEGMYLSDHFGVSLSVDFF